MRTAKEARRTMPKVVVPLPEGARAGEEEMEVLESAIRAIVALHFGSGREWKGDLRALQADGWKVRCDLVWRATAARGHDFEEATGATKAEALEHVLRLTGQDSVEGCP